LVSVYRALDGISGEVFVVDNNSIDGSVEMVQQKFPQVTIIANKENVGFSSANNQAIRLSSGKYVLLLNPDTVVSEDTFSKTISFLNLHPNAGGLGVRMIDGKGVFLPESKRGLPTPSVAFYKIFGLSALFPRSKKAGRYHLGFLPENETNKVDILSGAFMMMRKTALDKVGLLDEAFFMYGEDIDLSYRIQLGGYDNYYFPETNIIHYKGESTKKSSVNYVFVFYNAMIIFAKKHFSQNNANLFSILINLAIYLRAGFALLVRFIKKAILPFIDASLIITKLFFITHYWKTIKDITFDPSILQIALPGYTLIWMTSIYFSGGYDKPFRSKTSLYGTLLGTIFILTLYALLPKTFQFSRLFILVGAVIVSLYYIVSRQLLSRFIGGRFSTSEKKQKNFTIVGSAFEIERVEQLLKQSNPGNHTIYAVSASDSKSENQLGTISQLDQIVHLHPIDEVIFCAKDISSNAIINWMVALNKYPIDFKIAHPDSLFLIGSNSSNTNGELYTIDLYNINTPSNKRNKRTFDFVISFTGVLLVPFTIWFYLDKKQYLTNLIQCLIGKKTWVGFSIHSKSPTINLPKISEGIFTPTTNSQTSETVLIDKLNMIYARDYSVLKDWDIIKKNLRSLDRKS
jgi:O-antigen biosynthesis protein